MICQYCGADHAGDVICQQMFMSHGSAFARLNQPNPAAPLEKEQRDRSAGMCMYCGNVFHAKDTSNSEVARVYAEAIAHDQQCPDNPLVKRIRELEAAQSANAPSYAELAGAVARGWCSPNNAHKEMDSELAFAITVQVAALLGLDGAAKP